MEQRVFQVWIGYRWLCLKVIQKIALLLHKFYDKTDFTTKSRQLLAGILNILLSSKPTIKEIGQNMFQSITFT